MWQDYTIMVVVAMFTLTTLPMINSGIRLPLGTSLVMTLGSLTLAIVYATLGLYYALSVEVVSVGLWSILLSRSFKRTDVRSKNP